MWISTKRIIDIVLSMLVLLLLLPFFLLTSAAIYLHDFGAVFFRQQRVGHLGKTFWMYKFRSMVANAEHLGGYATEQGDARITKIGRFIRRTSLDELPQLFNVLKGDMSLVGPRPDVPAQKKLYEEDEWQLRHSVRPGITGLAQATLRSSATEKERKQMDLEYAKNSCLALDVKIMLMTIKQIFGKGGN